MFPLVLDRREMYSIQNYIFFPVTEKLCGCHTFRIKLYNIYVCACGIIIVINIIEFLYSV